jgi:predicted esterase
MPLSLPFRVVPLVCCVALALGCSDEASAPGDSGGASGSGGIAQGGAGGGGAPNGGSGGSAAPNGGSSGSSSGAGGSTAGGGGGGVMPSGGGGSGGAGGSGGLIDANGGAPTGPASSRHTARPSGSMQGTTAGYWEYLPPHYGNGALYPLLVFRHGVGENGSGMMPDLQKVTVHGPPKLIEADEWPEARPFVVLSVQHPGGGCPSPQEMDDFFNFALDSYDIDPKRVYLTGLSCGAIGSWNYLGDHVDETVAAAALICGDGRAAFNKIGCELGKVPVWAFHGEADDQVDKAGSIETITKLKACTNPAPIDAKLTTYPGVGHDSWTMTYNLSNPQNDLYAWLLTHTKP